VEKEINEPLKDLIDQEKYDQLHREILQKLKPLSETKRKLSQAVDELINKINAAIKSLKLDFILEPILVGSVAKNTYLANPDIDIFIMFPPSVPVEKLRSLGLEVGRLVLPDGQERYAEHPYLAGKFAGFDTDIVPCYKLASIQDRMTAVDRTPFHTKYIIEHLTAAQRDEVRLLKQFIKGIGAYGAEIEVLGFSGYLCELLILRYQTFLNLLIDAKNWPDELVFDLASVIPSSMGERKAIWYQPKTVLTQSLAQKFRNEPLVFIDPVDGARNVASALSKENLQLFIKAAQTYLSMPTPTYFFPNPVNPLTTEELTHQLDSEDITILSIRFQTPDVVPDILHGQLRKSQKMIARLLDIEGFGVKKAKYYSNEFTILLFELSKSKLPEIMRHHGPPVGHGNEVDFTSKWKVEPTAMSKPYKKGDRWYVDIKRKFTKPLDLLGDKLINLNIGKHVKEAIAKNVEMYCGIDVVRESYELPLTKFISEKDSWEY
jgi:tRNA nucleotidyltransferase (CCA-adding enzyme)